MEHIDCTVETLSSETIFNKTRLHEIKDSALIAKISATFPALASSLAQSTMGEVLKADIPIAELAKSKAVDGAFRGIKMGEKRIAKHASFTKASTTALTLANAMQIASAVVGQYYMKEIDEKLAKISNQLEEINDFQEREFKSAIHALIPQVANIIKFSKEIVDNEESRQMSLHTLERLKGEATKLLQQVNQTIEDLSKVKEGKPDYKKYTEKTKEFSQLLYYQKILLTLLREIGKLSYFLLEGKNSISFSLAIFQEYLQKSEMTNRQLEKWQEEKIKQFKISVANNQIEKATLSTWHKIPRYLPAKKVSYQELESGLQENIQQQKSAVEVIERLNEKPKELLEQNIEIIAKQGKYYYLEKE